MNKLLESKSCLSAFNISTLPYGVDSGSDLPTIEKQICICYALTDLKHFGNEFYYA